MSIANQTDATICYEQKGAKEETEYILGENCFPLSFPQQQMWFIDKLNQGLPLYNDAFTVKVKESLDAKILQECLNQLIERHEVLRTTFTTVDDLPVQVIEEPFQFPLEVIDLKEEPVATKEEKFNALSSEMMKRPIDLTNGPLSRAILAHFDDATSRLFFVSHHIIMDGTSVYQIFVPELQKLYSAAKMGKTAHLEEQEIQYADFSLWQRENYSEKFLESSMNYWKEKLADVPTLMIPVDHPYPEKPCYQGKRQCFEIPKELTEKLRALSKKEGISLFMTFTAAVKTLLHRYSGQRDLVVGTITSGRSRVEMEKMMGNFINPIVLRTDISEISTFRELLKSVWNTTTEAYSHQNVPFEHLVKEMASERTVGQSPIFQVPVVFQANRVDNEHPWEIALFDAHAGIAKFELSFTFDEQENYIVGAIEYRTALFEDQKIVRLIKHFENLLENIANNPSQKISKISLLNKQEYHQITQEWNNTAHSFQNDLTLHQLFEWQAKQTPNNIAVKFGNEQLTYEQLNNRANRIACRIQDLGIKPDDLVGLYMERSIDLVVGMLATLKSGGAYVPIDPEYPKERTDFMLEDANIKVLLTNSALTADLAGFKQHTIQMDRIAHAEQSEAPAPVYNSSTHDLAYVIYTSGTTGKPKGVMISHEAIINHMLWMNETFEFSEKDTFIQKTPFSFDASIWEFYAPLLTGGKLIIAEPGLHKDSIALTDLIAKEEITILQAVPSLLRMIADSDNLEKCKDLRLIFSGGEALTLDVEKRIFSKVKADLYNLYGPTEATIDSTYWHCLPDNEYDIAPIGKPIANCQAYILDSSLQPVPVGVNGELYIGGTPLARGYLNQPELTKEKFIDNPFGEPGSRLYKTGDLAQWAEDGTIHFKGRVDHQVKLRGYRIELGEIESVITSHEQVKQSVVVVREDDPGSQKLTAYVVPTDKPMNSQELVDLLNKNVPEYMVPTSFITLEELPTTPNGKIDRKALPAPTSEEPVEEKVAFAAPETETEKILAGIWEKILKVPKISVHDNFFQLGGDSLQSMMVLTATKRAGLTLNAKQLVEYQTIKELATVVGTSAPVQVKQGLVQEKSPITSAQYYVLELTKEEPNHFAMSSWLTVPTELTTQQVAGVLRELALHHDSLRVRFESTGEQWTQWEQRTAGKEAAEITVDTKNLIGLPQEEVDQQKQSIAYDQGILLDITKGPVMRGTLFRFSETEQQLFLSIHYLAADGMSWRVLQRDFERACDQLLQGKEIEFPPKTSPFAKWAEQLAKHVRTINPKGWLSENWDDLPWLPVDYQDGRENNTIASVEAVFAALEATETEKLLHHVPKKQDGKLLEILLGSLAHTFCTENQQSGVVVDVETHGREVFFDDIDLSETVGCYTIVFPVRFDGENSPEMTVQKAKEKLRSIDGMEYSLLRYMHTQNLVRDKLKQSPKVEVSFNYMGQYEKNTLAFSRTQKGKRPHLLEIDCFVAEGQLRMSWRYSSNVHNKETVQKLANAFMETLRSLL